MSIKNLFIALDDNLRLINFEHIEANAIRLPNNITFDPSNKNSWLDTSFMISEITKNNKDNDNSSIINMFYQININTNINDIESKKLGFNIKNIETIESLKENFHVNKRFDFTGGHAEIDNITVSSDLYNEGYLTNTFTIYIIAIMEKN